VSGIQISNRRGQLRRQTGRLLNPIFRLNTPDGHNAILKILFILSSVLGNQDLL
jgi:hypothetical protein